MEGTQLFTSLKAKGWVLGGHLADLGSWRFCFHWGPWSPFEEVPAQSCISQVFVLQIDLQVGLPQSHQCPRNLRWRKCFRKSRLAVFPAAGRVVTGTLRRLPLQPRLPSCKKAQAASQKSENKCTGDRAPGVGAAETANIRPGLSRPQHVMSGRVGSLKK